MTSPLVVACAADVRYAVPLAVMLRSAIGNLSPGTALEIYVVSDGLDSAARDRVMGSLPATTSLRWLERPQDEFAGLPNWGRMALTTYHKLTLGEWLPADVERAIWLDCDVLVTGDLARLWQLNLGPNVVLAAQDVLVPLVSSRFGVAGYGDLGLSHDAKYFNAGIMLIDVARWRREQVGAHARDYLRRFGKRVWFWDQEALNAALAGRWGALDPRWNWNPILHRPTIGNAAADPWILHFSGKLKPWTYRGTSPHHALYNEWLERTAWSDCRPTHSWRGWALGAYETCRLRSLLLPLEQFQMRLVRWLTSRL